MNRKAIRYTIYRTVSSLTLTAAPIVTAQWLVDHVDMVLVVDTRRVSDYLDGHVPGALSFPLGTLIVEDTRESELRSLGAAARSALAARGIDADSHIVLIDDNDGSASVGTFICELAGVRAVSAVHGGVRAWLHAGQDLHVAPTDRAATTFTGETNLTTVASFEDVVRAEQSGVRLVDTRSQLEHEGIVGSPCCQYRGHIPGSVNLEWSQLLAATGDLHGPDRIRAAAHDVGLSENDEIIVYCHTGQRSAVAGLALRAAGFTRVRNFLGSWHEWSHRGMPSNTDA